MGFNLPSGCSQTDIDRALGSDEDRYDSGFFCDACCDVGWLEAPEGVIACTECSQPFTFSDFGLHVE